MTDGLSVVHEIVNGNSFIIQQTPDLEKNKNKDDHSWNIGV